MLDLLNQRQENFSSVKVEWALWATVVWLDKERLGKRNRSAWVCSCGPQAAGSQLTLPSHSLCRSDLMQKCLFLWALSSDGSACAALLCVKDNSSPEESTMSRRKHISRTKRHSFSTWDRDAWLCFFKRLCWMRQIKGLYQFTAFFPTGPFPLSLLCLTFRA